MRGVDAKDYGFQSRRIGATPFPKVKKLLYHILPLKYLYQMLERKKFVLRKVGTWPDKYECYLDAIYARMNDGSIVDSFRFKESFFGASFSHVDDESDAMWQIYSPYKNSVRIGVSEEALRKLCKDISDKHCYITIRKKRDYEHQSLPLDVPPLLGSCITNKMKKCSDNTDYSHDISGGNENSSWADLIKVEYVSLEQINKKLIYDAEHLRDILDSSMLYPCSLNCLKYKKKAYQHENETRIIAYWENEDYLEDFGNSLAVDIDPSEFIKCITTDPRICLKDVQDIRDKVHSFGGMKGISVERSTLYDSPKLLWGSLNP